MCQATLLALVDFGQDFGFEFWQVKINAICIVFVGWYIHNSQSAGKNKKNFMWTSVFQSIALKIIPLFLTGGVYIW